MRSLGKPDADRLLKLWDEDDERCVQGLFFDRPFAKAACPLNPFRLNERLRIQKGVFLAPGDVAITFQENLSAMSGYDNANNWLKLILPSAQRSYALRQLFEMNISRTSLFPGLDGYATSLGIYHPVFNPVQWAD